MCQVGMEGGWKSNSSDINKDLELLLISQTGHLSSVSVRRLSNAFILLPFLSFVRFCFFGDNSVGFFSPFSFLAPSPDLSCGFWSSAPALCDRTHRCDQDMIKTHAHTGFGIHWGAASPAWRLHWDKYTGIHTGSVIRQCHRVQCVRNCVCVCVLLIRLCVLEWETCTSIIFCAVLTPSEGATCTFNGSWLTD